MPKPSGRSEGRSLMSKSFLQNAEDKSIFLVPSQTAGEALRKGERTDTSPLRAARLIDIDRIKPDPNQPRKTVVQETLESLAESVKELDGIIDPLTVAYDDQGDFFRIISGERRYRAAKMVGLTKLPCIIKEIDDKKRFLFQFIANLQREDISPLEESAGIKKLVENHGYSQVKITKLLNKSKSYVSQILGLNRLSESARKVLQTSEVSKEIQISASREKDLDIQKDIIKKATQEGKTVRQIRREQKTTSKPDAKTSSSTYSAESNKNPEESTLKEVTFHEWSWKPDDKEFMITIRFSCEKNGSQKYHLVKGALEKTLEDIGNGDKMPM